MEQANIWNRNRRTTYRTVTGAVTGIRPAGGRNSDCSQLVTVEDASGSITVFMLTPETYVADAATIYRGMQAHFIYNTDLPAPLIYPPQYMAAAVVSTVISSNVAAGFFDSRLVNSENTLQLTMTENVPVVTSNNQMFFGSPENRYLIVMYERSTRSIPAQTTPERVVVMCEW